MVRFIQILQLIILVVVGAFVGYDLVLYGVSIFDNKYITISLSLMVLLVISLFVIVKLIEDD
ncbi:hypothetical protein BCU68_00555 [Vibrio sp. 10N.286.49.B3]|uniref:hypothetical protein n=1 Tax=Vibrio sp. 10N.286.49.B3 TaxID=1880855 RepID=UPI000C85CBFD|nr:hypothetical protein [Vibrio sp. 10N.286.49.B3]PMH46573.1 hypothetical protein BCU68_00555 [Vibrio sp. 10N.286.49.B3]